MIIYRRGVGFLDVGLRVVGFLEVGLRVVGLRVVGLRVVGLRVGLGVGFGCSTTHSENR